MLNLTVFSNLIKEILLSNFKNIEQNLNAQKREISTKITNLTNRLESAREKYLEDKLDFEDYNSVKEYYKLDTAKVTKIKM